ncbi:hypothetical protein NSQ95_00595 [Psychrobacillus sp. FSL W7-1457]|uniref:hypothetical protein n=1 Tax=Psychrobacillus sp. FSL W7-1457 TaxID=2954547 RepID=UPI00315AD2E3
MNTYEEERLHYKDGSPIKTSTEMTVMEWIITMLIMAIPIVNLVMLFIWGFGNPDPRRNFARASLIWMAISIGLVIIIYIVIIVFFLAAFQGVNY